MQPKYDGRSVASWRSTSAPFLQKWDRLLPNESGGLDFDGYLRCAEWQAAIAVEVYQTSGSEHERDLK